MRGLDFLLKIRSPPQANEPSLRRTGHQVLEMLGRAASATRPRDWVRNRRGVDVVAGNA